MLDEVFGPAAEGIHESDAAVRTLVVKKARWGGVWGGGGWRRVTADAGI